MAVWKLYSKKKVGKGHIFAANKRCLGRMQIVQQKEKCANCTAKRIVDRLYSKKNSGQIVQQKE